MILDNGLGDGGVMGMADESNGFVCFYGKVLARRTNNLNLLFLFCGSSIAFFFLFFFLLLFHDHAQVHVDDAFIIQFLQSTIY